MFVWRIALFVLLVATPVWAQPTFDPIIISNWATGRAYPQNSMVRFDNTIFICQPALGCPANESPQNQSTGKWNALSGVFEWRSDQNYFPGAIGSTVMRVGNLYTAIVASGPGAAAGAKDPISNTNPTYWQPRGVASSPGASTNIAMPGVTTRAGIQAAIDSLPTGGIVQLLCTTYTLDGTAITVPKRMTIQGCGESTRLSSPSGSIFALTATESTAFDGAIVIRDMSLIVGSGGTAIVGNPASQTRGNIFENLTISGGSVGIDIQTNTSVNTILNSRFVGQTSYGVKLVNAAQGCEAGDNAIVASNFFPAANGSSGGVFVSVGGFRFIGSKVLDQASNNPRTHYGIRTEAQCSTETLISASEIDQVDIPVSFGNCSLGGGCYGAITITGNYLRGTQNTISLVGASGGLTSYSSVSITGNVIDSILSGGTVIDLEQVLNSTITGNVINASTGWTTLRLKDSRFITWSSSNSMLSFDTTNPFNFVSGLSNVAIESSRTDLGNGFIFTLANLPTASGLNGSVMACSNCKNPSDGAFTAGVCASGGTGNTARRLNNIWICS